MTQLPSKVDYHDRLPPPRHEGGRGTCVAFSSVAAREFLLGARSTAADLSEQFLYWACKGRDKYGGEGTFVKVAMAVLEDTGVCPEDIWRYNPVKVPGNEGQGPPPEHAVGLAHGYKIGGWTPLDPKSTYELRGDAGRGATRRVCSAGFQLLVTATGALLRRCAAAPPH